MRILLHTMRNVVTSTLRMGDLGLIRFRVNKDWQIVKEERGIDRYL
jgi:hypothetical protein